MSSSSNIYVQQIRQQGKDPSKAAPSQIVPDWYLKRHPNASYTEYREALADFVNSN